MRVREEIRNRWLSLLLPWALFIVVLALYSLGSHLKHRENPKDKLMPNASQLMQGVQIATKLRGYRPPTAAVAAIPARPATESTPARAVVEAVPADPGSPGKRWIVEDLKASLTRLIAGMSLSITVAVLVGLHMGAFPFFETLGTRFIEFFSFVPPLALLPLVFIYLGVSEGAKIAIIFLGTVFILTQDVYLRIKEVPQRYIHQAYARGASTFEVLFKICLKHKIPAILDSIRLAMRPAWVYLIAAELIAASAGLGYRIRLVERQLGVHIIIPYILAIATIGFLFDLAIRMIIRTVYPWSQHR